MDLKINPSVIFQPAIEAETVVSKPSAVIDELGVGAADGTAIVSAVMSPLTDNVLPTNCKKFPLLLFPNSIA